MILVDANVLLYAYDPRSTHHKACKAWVESAFAGPAPVLLPWLSILAFLRIATSRQVYERPLTPAEAGKIVSRWLALPTVIAVTPGERFWQILAQLLTESQAAGPLVPDAALAALAIENGASVCTTDRDFLRFPPLTLVDPTTPTP